MLSICGYEVVQAEHATATDDLILLYDIRQTRIGLTK